MAVALSLVFSFVAVVATFYQAHLQRVHNRKSVKPLAQIDLEDREGLLFVHVQNNGVGPLIVDKLIFTRDGKQYHQIQDCLDLDPKSYYHIEITDTNKKIIVPGGFLVVFSEKLDLSENQATITMFRQQLSAIHLEVEGHDIYDIKISIGKCLKWFARHI